MKQGMLLDQIVAERTIAVVHVKPQVPVWKNGHQSEVRTRSVDRVEISPSTHAIGSTEAATTISCCFPVKHENSIISDALSQTVGAVNSHETRHGKPDVRPE
jgi:hypothetical protein